MNQEIQGQLPRDLLYEEREIILTMHWWVNRYKLYKKLSEENEFHYVGVPSSKYSVPTIFEKSAKISAK